MTILFDGMNFWATIGTDTFIMPAKIALQFITDQQAILAYKATQGENWPQ